MKKILSVLCVLAFVASFACVSVSADDAAIPAFELVADDVYVGAESVDVALNVVLPEGVDIAQAGFLLEYDEGLTLTAADKAASVGMFMGSQTLDVKPYSLLWVGGADKIAESGALVKLSFAIPADAVAGTVYNVTVNVDPENLPANIDGVEFADAQGATLAIEIKEEPVVTEPVTEPVTDETKAPVADETKAPVADESEATEAPETTKPAPQTGDNTTMMFVVVAVMVVALGAAVVVKKVNN